MHNNLHLIRRIHDNLLQHQILPQQARAPLLRLSKRSLCYPVHHRHLPSSLSTREIKRCPFRRIDSTGVELRHRAGGAFGGSHLASLRHKLLNLLIALLQLCNVGCAYACEEGAGTGEFGGGVFMRGGGCGEGFRRSSFGIRYVSMDAKRDRDWNNGRRTRVEIYAGLPRARRYRREMSQRVTCLVGVPSRTSMFVRSLIDARSARDLSTSFHIVSATLSVVFRLYAPSAVPTAQTST